MDLSFASAIDWATLVAAPLALVAIVISVLSAARGSRQVTDSRYVALQTELLRELVDIVNGAYLVPSRESTGRAGTLRWRAARARLRVVDAELPTARTRYEADFEYEPSRMVALGVTTDGEDSINDKIVTSTGKRVRDAMFEEFLAALTDLATADSRRLKRLRKIGRARRIS